MPLETSHPRTPEFSIIIAVYNDWGPLEGCLESLNDQDTSAPFEVIVVDDGSEQSAPEAIRQRKGSLSLSFLRQEHTGTAAARNRGVKESNGEILVFTDADCRFQPKCLSVLASVIRSSPQHNCFQLHLTGDSSNLVGRAEELRLLAIQDRMVQENGCIRYLNTSGFAIRRSHRSVQGAQLFDPLALRGEDTLLLATLIRGGELPLFVSSATVQHSISLPLAGCFRKDIHAAWLEGRTYNTIAASGVSIRMKNRERLRMLVSTWRIARQHSLGTLAWIVLVLRQILERTVSFIYNAMHPPCAGPADTTARPKL